MARFSSSFAHAGVEAPPAGRSVPLDLRNLLTPFKGRGKLTLRIERLPEGARLSAGSNNGDRTWSVARDELENLSYIPPSAGDQTDTLSVRIIGTQGGEASTLALFDIPLANWSGGDGTEPAADLNAKIPGAGESRGRTDTAKPRPLRIAEKTGQEQNTGPSDAEIEARIARELETARAAWKGEMDQLLAEAAAKAASELEDSQNTWQAEQEERAAATEKDSNDRLTTIRQKARRETEETLAKAERVWRQDEAARLAAAEAEWQALEKKVRAEAQAERKLADRRHEAECRPLRDELAQAKTALAGLEAKKNEIEVAAGQANDQWQQKLNAALSAAENSWKASEAQRLKETEAALRQEFEQTLAALPPRPDPVAAQQADELRDLQETVTVLRDMLSGREAELEQQQAAHQRGQADADAAMAMALARWKAEEAERLKMAEAQWQGRSAETQAALTARCEASEAALAVERSAQKSGENDNIQNLARQLQSLQATLAEREAALVARCEAAEATLAAERSAQKSGEDANVQNFSRQLQSLQATLAERETALIARCEAAEAALIAERSTRKSGEDADVQNFVHQLQSLQATLAERETTLIARCEAAEAALIAERSTRKSGEDADIQTLGRQLQNLQAASAEREAALTARCETLEASLIVERSSQKPGQDADAQTLTRQMQSLQTASAEREAALTVRCESLQAALAAEQAASAAKQSDDDAYTNSLARQLKTLQASLVDREAALAHAHTSLAELSRRWQTETTLAHGPSSLRIGTLPDESPRDKKPNRRLGRDLALVVVVAMATVLFFPGSGSGLSSYLESALTTVEGLVHIQGTDDNVSSPSLPAAPAAKAAQPLASVLKTVNLRAQPSVTATVVASLPRDRQVTVLERKGKWAHVRLSGGQAGASEGWVYASYLGEAGGKTP